MKNKSAKISTDQLFFSHTWNFLNVYLVKQVGRSQATAESYRDSLTIFKNYLADELGKSISTFQFSDCTKECIYNFREYLLANGSQPSTVNVRVKCKSRGYPCLSELCLGYGHISPVSCPGDQSDLTMQNH